MFIIASLRVLIVARILAAKAVKGGVFPPPPRESCLKCVACCKFSNSLSLKVNTSAIHQPRVSFEYSAWPSALEWNSSERTKNFGYFQLSVFPSFEVQHFVKVI